MNIGRRSLLTFVGGAAVGTVLTPVPWKLMSDSALWSQNWSWIPRLPVGERKVKYTSCTLCPAGCGVKANCVGDQPVSLVGSAHHPLSGGTLCAIGLAAHHLPYHPRRASRPLKMDSNGKHVPITFDAAAGEIAEAIKQRTTGELVAILDERPGRTLSYAYRRFLAGIEGGVYATPPERETVTLTLAAAMSGMPRLGFDLTPARAILSFGAPILDGWGVPAPIYAARYRSESPVKLIQVETKQSRTASLADSWLPARPGTEAAVALGIAYVLVAKSLVPAEALGKASDAAEYRALIAQFTPEAVSSISGIPPETIVSTAELLAANRPAVAIGGGDPGGGPARRGEELAVAGLNLLLGAVGAPGGLVPREEPPVPAAWHDWKLAAQQRLEDLPDHSVAVMILGEAPSGDALPWGLIERKLVRGRNIVVSLAPFVEGPSRRANYIVPAPAFLETLEELPTPPISVAVSLAIAPALLKPPPGAVDPLKLLARLGGSEETLADLVKQRVESIHSSKRGLLTDSAGSAKVAEVEKASEIWDAMNAGAVWTADPLPAKAPARYALLGGEGARVLAAGLAKADPQDHGYPLVLMPYAWRGASGSAALPPLLTKVYQESLLRASSHQCRLHPVTAGEFEIHDGDRVTIDTRCGSCVQRAWVDASVMPGVIEVPSGPQSGGGDENVLDICGPVGDCTWSAARARIRRLA